MQSNEGLTNEDKFNQEQIYPQDSTCAMKTSEVPVLQIKKRQDVTSYVQSRILQKGNEAYMTYISTALHSLVPFSLNRHKPS